MNTVKIVEHLEIAAGTYSIDCAGAVGPSIGRHSIKEKVCRLYKRRVRFCSVRSSKSMQHREIAILRDLVNRAQVSWALAFCRPVEFAGRTLDRRGYRVGTICAALKVI